MANQILVLDGDMDAVCAFRDELMELGMVLLEMDGSAKTLDSFLANLDDPQYSFSLGELAEFVIALLGTSSLVEIIKGIVNAHKGEGSMEWDEHGNIRKLSFKNMTPEDVAKLISKVSEVTTGETVLN